jgi:AraC family transcriptional regulator
METTQLLIKNMVCNRCIKVVTEELEKLGLKVVNVSLGKAVIEGGLGKKSATKLRTALKENGFELIEDKKGQIIEQIKTLLINLIHYNQEETPLLVNYSKYISENLDIDYAYLTTLFSEEEGITIEKFIILQKIERVKELLTYQELTLSEIAYQMNYSSVQYLSNQFRKVTGLTPTAYKQQTENQRKTLDSVSQNLTHLL